MRYKRVTPRRDYQRPPLVEVLFELRFEKNHLDALLPGLLEPLIRDDFPSLEQAPELLTNQDRQKNEVSFVNASRTLIARISRGRFTLSSIRPTGETTYIGFESLQHGLNKLLQAFCQIHPDCKPTRLSYRYVNHIALPPSPVSMNKLFHLGTYFPAFLVKPGWINTNFALDATFRLDQSEGESSVRIQLRPVLTLVGERFLLDLDCFSETRIELIEVNDWLVDAHNLAGDVFESCIGNELRELFEEKVIA